MPADIPSRVAALCAEFCPQLSPQAVGLLVRAAAPFAAVDGLVALEQHPPGSERVDLVIRLSRPAAGALLARPEGLEPRVRSFLSRWLAFVFEIRDYMWIDKYENLNVAPLITDRVDPNTWYQSGSSLVNNVSMGVGLTFFIPPRFEYRLPK